MSYGIVQRSDGRAICLDNNRFVRLDISPKMSDEQIREEALKAYNGSYIYKICKGCGSFWAKEDGQLDSAKIINQCGECFDEDSQ